MILPRDVLTVPPRTGFRILAREPFLASTSTDSSGKIRRKPPVEVLDPHSECPEVHDLIAKDLIEPVEIFAAEIPDGILVGERAIVIPATKPKRSFLRQQLSEGFVVTDTLHPEHTSAIFKGPHRRRFENVHLDVVEGGFEYGSTPRLHVTLDDECVVMTAMEQANYGSFLLRLVPKVIFLKKLGLMGLPILTATKGWQGNILQAFGVNLANTISYVRTRNYSGRKLIVPSMRPNEFFVDDATRDLLQDMAARISHEKKDAPKHERLYVSRLAQGRKSPNHRLLLNEEKLIEAMSSLGFRIFEPEAHSFQAQVHAFASARIVVGPGGAGMFNTLFCRPGTTVVSIEPMLNWLVHHMNMFASMDHNYSLVLGGTDKTDPNLHKRWRAEIGTVTDLVKRLMP